MAATTASRSRSVRAGNSTSQKGSAAAIEPTSGW